MREQFENLPSIKPFKSAFKFNEEIGEYVRNDSHYLQSEYSLGFFNGAWYAYQEQQKKIDALKEAVHLAMIEQLRAEKSIMECILK